MEVCPIYCGSKTSLMGVSEEPIAGFMGKVMVLHEFLALLQHQSHDPLNVCHPSCNMLQSVVSALTRAMKPFSGRDFQDLQIVSQWVYMGYGS